MILVGDSGEQGSTTTDSKSKSEPSLIYPHLGRCGPYRHVGSGDLFGLDSSPQESKGDRRMKSGEAVIMTPPYPNLDL